MYNFNYYYNNIIDHLKMYISFAFLFAIYCLQSNLKITAPSRGQNKRLRNFQL